MRLFMEILEFSPLDIGFDMLSIIREYQEVVPYEFDFAREGKMQVRLRLLTWMPPLPWVPSSSGQRCANFLHRSCPFHELRTLLDPSLP